MRNRIKSNSGSYVDALIADCPEILSNELKSLVENSANLSVTILGGHKSDLTFAFSSVMSGCFNLADYFLQNTAGEFRLGSDPCFIGTYVSDYDATVTIHSLLRSTGVNFYLAQIVYRFAKKHDQRMYQALVSGEQSYFDTLYWLQDGVKIHCPMAEETASLLAPMAKIYWQVATEIVELEQVVADSRCPEQIKEITHNDLANRYVKLAMEEKKYPDAYGWLLQKAYTHLKAAGKEQKQAILLAYVNLENNEKDRVHIRVDNQFRQQTDAGKEALLEQFSLLDNNPIKDQQDSSGSLEAAYDSHLGLRRRPISSARTATTFGHREDHEQSLEVSMGDEQHTTKVSAH